MRVACFYSDENATYLHTNAGRSYINRSLFRAN